MGVEKEYPAHPDLTGGEETDLHKHAAAGAQVATGSYTGDGTANRQITTGFKCSRVVIMGGRKSCQWEIIPDISFYHTALDTPLHCIDSAYSWLHASDGFVVNKGCGNNANYYGANENTYTFYYWAISE